jgi:hypothetical protein
MTEPDPAEIPHESTPPSALEVIDHVGDPSPPYASVSAPSPDAAPRRGGTPLLLTLLLFAGLGGGLYWVWLHPNAGAAAPAADQQAAIDSAKSQLAAQVQEAEQGLGQQIQALSGRVTTLERQAQDRPAAPPGDTAPSAAPDAVAGLAKRLDDLSATVAALSAKQDSSPAEPPKSTEAGPPPPGPDVAALVAQQQEADSKIDHGLAQQKAALETLDQRLAKLEQAAGQDQPTAQTQSQDAAALAALNARLGRLEQGQGQDQAKDSGAAKDATLAIKLEAAQAALLAGQPLGALPNAPPALSRFATTPPPTEAGLRAAFPQAAAAALAASRPDTAQQSFFQRALARIQQTVTVRRGDHVIVGDPAAGVLARAQDDVSNGDLKGATEALRSLNGPAQAAVQGWVAQVNALLDARAALASLAAHG